MSLKNSISIVEFLLYQLNTISNFISGCKLFSTGQLLAIFINCAFCSISQALQKFDQKEREGQ